MMMVVILFIYIWLFVISVLNDAKSWWCCCNDVRRSEFPQVLRNQNQCRRIRAVQVRKWETFGNWIRLGMICVDQRKSSQSFLNKACTIIGGLWRLRWLSDCIESLSHSLTDLSQEPPRPFAREYVSTSGLPIPHCPSWLNATDAV